jgi:tetratricopeptide (TPR) repeat protein
MALKLGNTESIIKTLDMQASCHEQMGNFEEALSLVAKLISNYKTSPVGYLRMGKLLRLKKDLIEAEKVYKIGLIKASKKDPLYEILEKQIKTVQSIMAVKSTQSIEFKIEEDKNQIYGKGNVLSLPLHVLNQIFSQTNRTTLKSFASTCNFSHLLVIKGIFTGSFGMTSLRALKNSNLYSKLMKEHGLLEKFNQSAILSIQSESSTLLFLMYLKKNMGTIKKSLRVTNLSLGPMRPETVEIFDEVLNRGLRLKRLKLDYFGFSKPLCLNYLTELVLNNHESRNQVKIDANLLEALIVSGKEGLRSFSNCKHLKYLIYPSESDFNSFSSDKIILASLKYEQCLTMRPRPIKYLSLNGNNSTTSYSCIDLTQYSYECINVLNLEGFSLINSFNQEELIKSSCWSNLKCLRLTKLFSHDPQKDLTWILSKCPKSLKSLEIVSLPLSNLVDFNISENGIWLIDLIFKYFPNLEHLILGDLTLGPSAVNFLIKKILIKQLKQLKVFGFIKIQTIGFNFEILYQSFQQNYKMSNLLITDRQYQNYCEEYNLFKHGKIFMTLP